MKNMIEGKNQKADKIYNIGSVTNLRAESVVVYNALPSSPEPQLPDAAARKHYITDDKKRRYVLDDYSDDDEFEFYPDRLYVLSLYFITLSAGQEYYALFDYVSYAPTIKGGRVNDDIWSVPYTITPIDLGGKKVRKVKEIRKAYSQSLPDLSGTLSTLESNLFYNLGIVYKEIEKGREYIEYKRSTTEPDKMRCNYVREFFVHEIDSTGVVNLTDPECLHQHRYLPFSFIDQLPPSGGLIRFMDKPIPDNVSDILLYERRRLMKNAVRTAKSDLIYQMEGQLFCITLMNRDTLLSATHMLSSLMDQAMLYGNVGFYCIDGANLLGCLPAGSVDFTDLLCRMHAGLSEIHPGLTVCCTTHFCRFEYGKTLGLTSRTPSFSGIGYEQLLSLDLGTAHVWQELKDRPDILFAWDMRNKEVRFNPKGVKVFRPDNYKEENRTMDFKIWKKGT